MRISDLELLNEGKWLNDTILDYMVQRELENFRLSNRNKDNTSIYVMLSSMGHLIRDISDPKYLSMAIVPTDELLKYSLLLVPVSDNTGAHSGGSHWSLLLLQLKVDIENYIEAYHFDSNEPMNAAPAMKLAASLAELMSGQSNSSTSSKNLKFFAINIPQQKNSNDCGVFCIQTAKIIIRNQEKIAKTDKRKELLSDIVSTTLAEYWDMKKARKEMLESLH